MLTRVGSGLIENRMARKLVTNPKLAIGILRVSTEDQNLGPQAQAAALDAWAARNGVQLLAVFFDHGVSGAAPLSARTGLLDALVAMRQTGAGVLVAAKRDRIARDPMLVGLIEREVSKLGGVVLTADGASDVRGPEGVMMRGVQDVFAAYEREMIIARTKAALAVKKARGERAGCIAYGFQLGADGLHVEPHAEEQATIAQALALRAEGRSIRQIASELAARGIHGRTGRALSHTQVHRLVTR